VHCSWRCRTDGPNGWAGDKGRGRKCALTPRENKYILDETFNHDCGRLGCNRLILIVKHNDTTLAVGVMLYLPCNGVGGPVQSDVVKMTGCAAGKRRGWRRGSGEGNSPCGTSGLGVNDGHGTWQSSANHEDATVA